MRSLFSGRSSAFQSLLSATALLACLFSAPIARAQDDVLHLEGSRGADRIRLAAADFKATTTDVASFNDKHVFDTTLYADLNTAGIFDLVSKSIAPQTSPAFPAEINLSQWSAAPASAAMVTFGNLSIQNGRLIISGFLDDAKNPQYPQVFAKQYNEEATEDMARQIAHRFADEIIFRLGGGTAGIAESKIYYVKMLSGNKEIWEMDYDGDNQHAVTHLGTISISPRISPDNNRLAFSSISGNNGFQLKMFSMLTNKEVFFPSAAGTNGAPAWTAAGDKLAFSSSRTGHSEIWVSDPEGRLAHKITNYGADTSPTWNPKTGSQIAFISGRKSPSNPVGIPQLYIMDADGSGVQRMTDGGYASSPSWSPNGQFIAFAWERKYGPGAPGGQDIYIMEVASLKYIQLTVGIGRCDFPTWSPDGRHLAFANSPDGSAAHTRIMTMLIDGTQKHVLTGPGADMPNWSWK
jgi:TolB protein